MRTNPLLPLINSQANKPKIWLFKRCGVTTGPPSAVTLPEQIFRSLPGHLCPYPAQSSPSLLEALEELGLSTSDMSLQTSKGS